MKKHKVPCFNRDIVECKGFCIGKSRIQSDFVLIETQWNVKKEIDDEMQKDSFVLIETQWNVKKDMIQQIMTK